MSKLKWDAPGEKMYEAGVDHAVLYPVNESNEYTPGVAWNGITQISESPEGAEPNKQYADNIPYLTLMSAEELNGSIEALMYPPEWNACDGNVEIAKGAFIGQQNRKTFGLCYRTILGNDVAGEDYGYKLHLIYGAKASPSERTHETINDSPEAGTLSWEFSTTPVNVTGHKPTASVELDSTLVPAEKMAAIEEILYGKDPTTEGGDDGVAPRLPLPDEVATILAGASANQVMAARASYKVASPTSYNSSKTTV